MRAQPALGGAVAVFCFVAAMGLALFSPLAGGAPKASAASIKGVVDFQLEQNPAYPPSVDAVAAAQIIATMGLGSAATPGLHASWTRVLVYWDGLQPKAPGRAGATYDQAYVNRLRMIVGMLTAAHIKVILTPTSVPRWASDERLWASPPTDFATGYGPWFAIDPKNARVVTAFRGMITYLAAQLGPLGATRFEVWNEPNISRTLYPQRRGKVGDYGVRVYDAMLRACWQGVKSVSTSYIVIAGGTAPYGNNSTGSTSPISWARNLKKHHMDRYFDAYSHHPYQVLGSVNTAPNQMPSDPAHMVNLANLSVLLNMFPSKPFYITEYGYGTGFNPQFGIQVSEATQAAYLTKAYAMARSHKQVKALIWYMLRDWAPNPAHPDTDGVYTGLQKIDGTLKKSWTAFRNVQ